MRVYFRFLVVGAVMIGLAYLLTFIGLMYESLPVEVMAFAVAIAGALLLFRGLLEFLQDVFSGEYRRRGQGQAGQG